jgi:hypothetical protein
MTERCNHFQKQWALHTFLLYKLSNPELPDPMPPEPEPMEPPSDLFPAPRPPDVQVRTRKWEGTYG